MRVIFACGLLALMGASVAGAATAPEFVGNTIVLKTPDGTIVKWYANADGTYARVFNVKDKMLARNGTWRMQGNRLCIKDDGSTAENCWTYHPTGFGKWQTTHSDHGQTAQAEIIRGH